MSSVLKDELERLLLNLRKRGLSDKIAWEVWFAGNLPTARDIGGLTTAQIADLNAVAQGAAS